MENIKKKHTGSNILIIMLILIILASTGIGLYSWAKYQTTVEGTATGETAKWSFNVKDGNTETSDIDFPMTRTDNNDSVAKGKLAPGTYGELKLEIDASGTETSLIYVIEATMENKPQNLRFYSDAERTQELVVSNNVISKRGYMKVDEVGAREEKIYWEWPYETGTSSSQIAKNDEIDTEDSNKVMSVNVAVSGEQIIGDPVLADLVQVGDYVDYDASSNGVKTFTSADCLAGTSISGTISTSDNFDYNVNNAAPVAQWRVLDVDRENDVVELISTDTTTATVNLKGIDGYANGINLLNNIGNIYGQGKGAIEGRSINMDDIDKYSSFIKNDAVNNPKYGTTKTCTFKTPENTSLNLDGAEVKKITGSTDNPATVTFTYYTYKLSTYVTNSMAFNVLFRKGNNSSEYKSGYWAATSSVYTYSNSGNFANFGIHIIADGYVGDSYMYASNGFIREKDSKMVPVVTLESKLKTTGKDANGVWQLKVD